MSLLSMLCDHRAFMSPESCSKVLRPADKPCHHCDNRDPINQEHVFFFVFHFELTPFSLNVLCLSVFTSSWCVCLYISGLSFCIVYNVVLSPPYLRNARSGPSRSRWPALITLLTLANFPLVWCRLCDVVLFPSCLVPYGHMCTIFSRKLYSLTWSMSPKYRCPYISYYCM